MVGRSIVRDTNSSFVFILIGAILLISVQAQPWSDMKKCTVNFFRRVGRSQSIVWTCDCGNEAVGRVAARGPSTMNDTMARFVQQVRCFDFQRKKRSLRQVCEHNPSNFVSHAKSALDNCQIMKQPSKALVEKYPGPFEYARDDCNAIFVGYDGVEATGSLWICLCRQNMFKNIFPKPQIAVGRVGLDTKNSPWGASREIDLIRSCASSMKVRMQPICSSKAGRFNLLAAQLLEVCCKRVRKMFPNAKFECKSVVPKDVSKIQAP